MSIQYALNFRLDAIPSTGGKFAKQFSIETRMDSQAFGDGENYLSVRHWQTNIFGDVNAGYQRPLLVTRGASASWTVCGTAGILGYRP